MPLALKRASLAEQGFLAVSGAMTGGFVVWI